MTNLNENTVTAAVQQRQAQSQNPRLREIMDCLVKHLHDFARETKLTEGEWQQAIEFLTDAGHMCSETRQEFILLSDVLGLSTLVVAQNHRKPDGCTEATVLGPFHVSDAPHFPLGADLSQGMVGEPCYVSGRVVSLTGEVIPSATIEVWQADAEGFYDVQRTDASEYRGRGVLQADEAGHFHFKSIVAEPYPIPHDGPVGRLIEGLGRHPWRPAHLHFMISAPGYEKLITHLFRRDGLYLDSDVVFGVRSSLIADWVKHGPGLTPDGTTTDRPYYVLHHEFVLNPSCQ